MARTGKKIDFAAIGGTAVGVAACNLVSSFVPVENAMIKQAAPVALGFLLRNQKGIVGGIATGLMAGGVANVVSGFIAPVNGYYTTAAPVSGYSGGDFSGGNTEMGY